MFQGVLLWWWCRDGLVVATRLLVLRHLYLMVRHAAIRSISCQWAGKGTVRKSHSSLLLACVPGLLDATSLGVYQRFRP